MSRKDWFDEYMDYKLSGCEEKKEPSEESGCVPWCLGVIIFLWVFLSLFN